MAEQTQPTEYEKIASKYTKVDSALKAFPQISHDPSMRIWLGQELAGTPDMFKGLANDEYYLGMSTFKDQTLDTLVDETEKNLATMLNGAISSDVDSSLGYIALTASPNKPGSWTKVAEKHQKLEKSFKILKEENYEAMFGELVKVKSERLMQVLDYIKTSHPERIGMVYAGYHQMLQEEFIKEFKDEKGKVDKEKLKRYTLYVASDIKENKEKYVNLGTGLYSISKREQSKKKK